MLASRNCPLCGAGNTMPDDYDTSVWKCGSRHVHGKEFEQSEVCKSMSSTGKKDLRFLACSNSAVLTFSNPENKKAIPLLIQKDGKTVAELNRDLTLLDGSEMSIEKAKEIISLLIDL